MLSEENGVGYFSVSNAIFDNRDLQIDAIGIVTFAALCRHANRQAVCRLSHETLAAECRLSRRSVIRCLARLEAVGLIAIHSGKTRRTVSSYQILLKPERRKKQTAHREISSQHCERNARDCDSNASHTVTLSHTKDLFEGPMDKDPQQARGDFSASDRQATARQKTDQEAAAIAAKGGRWQGLEIVVSDYRRQGVAESRILDALNRLSALEETVKSPTGFLKKILDEAQIDQQQQEQRKQHQEEKERLFKLSRAQAARERDVCLTRFGGIDLRRMVEQVKRSGNVEIIAKENKFEKAA